MSFSSESEKIIEWTPELVERFWTGVARTRLSEISSSRNCADRVLELIEPYLSVEGRYLDYGAGDGDLVATMVRKGYRTAAYEPNTSRLNKLLSAVREHSNFLGVVPGSAQQPFDGIFMVEVIEHILEPQVSEIFHQVRHWLKRDGRIIVTTPFSEDLELNGAFCPACQTFFHRWQHVRCFNVDTLAEFMDRQGFQCEWQGAVDFSLNRFVVEELNAMNAEIDRLHAHIARSFCERIRRFFGGTTEHRKRYPTVSLRECPTNIVYVGRCQ